MLLPFQPYEVLPEVLASADVLLAILEPEAGVFSVPSKVLSYHCAGRPILAAIPAENLAARIIERARQRRRRGSRRDEQAFVAAARRLLDEPERRAAHGRAGPRVRRGHVRHRAPSPTASSELLARRVTDEASTHSTTT